MKKILLLLFILTIPLYSLSQIHLVEGEFKYTVDNTSSKWFKFTDKKIKELYSNASLYFDGMDNCYLFKTKDRIEVNAKILDKHIRVMGMKYPLTINYKINLIFNDNSVNVSCPIIEEIYLTNSSYQKLYMERGTSSLSGVYMYKKNGDVRFDKFEKELTDYFNSVYAGLQNSLESPSDIFQETWLDRDYMLYKKSFLKTKNKCNRFSLEKSFYFSVEDAINKLSVAYEKEPNKTDFEKIKNRVFFVDTILIVKDNYLGIETRNPYFVLKDTLSNEILFYKYPVLEDDFPFLCYNFKTEYQKNDLLHKIEKEVDDFDNKTRYYSELNQNAVIQKVIDGSNYAYYLRLKTIGSTLNVDGAGVWVMFDDGTKWHRPDKIKVDAKEGDGWFYTCFVKLTDEDLLLFSSKKIKKYRLYIYDEDMDISFSNRFKLYVEIMKDMN